MHFFTEGSIFMDYGLRLELKCLNIGFVLSSPDVN